MKNYYKKILTVIFFLQINLFAQDVVSQKLQIDLLYGTTNKSGDVLGSAYKNIFYNGFGIYFHTIGSGTSYTGETGIDFRSIADRTITEYYPVENNTYGMSFGITYDLSKVLKKNESGFTLFLGSGYAIEQEVSTRFEYYVWDDLPKLNSGNTITWISNEITVSIFEILVGYDFIKNGHYKLNINCGFATITGLVGIVGVGISL